MHPSPQPSDLHGCPLACPHFSWASDLGCELLSCGTPRLSDMECVSPGLNLSFQASEGGVEAQRGKGTCSDHTAGQWLSWGWGPGAWMPRSRTFPLLAH